MIGERVIEHRYRIDNRNPVRFDFGRLDARKTASSLKRPMRASIAIARASGAKSRQGVTRAKCRQPSRRSVTPALLNVSIMRCSSPTLIQVISSHSSVSAGSVSPLMGDRDHRVAIAARRPRDLERKNPVAGDEPELSHGRGSTTPRSEVRDEIDQPADFGAIAPCSASTCLMRVFAQQFGVKERAERHSCRAATASGLKPRRSSPMALIPTSARDRPRPSHRAARPARPSNRRRASRARRSG